MTRNSPGPAVILLAAVMADLAAAQTVFIQPVYLSTLAYHARLGVDLASVVLSSEMLAFACSTIAMAFVSHRINWRTAMVMALVVIVLGNLASFFFAETNALLPIRLCVGVASGVIVPLVFAIIGRLARPERFFGLLIGSVLILAALFLALMPGLTEKFGIAGLMGTMMLVAMFALLMVRILPGNPADAEAGPTRMYRPSLRQAAALFAMFLFFMQVTSIWSMASVIGTENGLSDQTIGQALALSQLAGIAGTSVPAFAGGRLPPFGAIGIGILVCASPCIVLLAEISDWSFLISVCLLQFGWNMGHAYLLAMFARLDSRSGIVVAATAMQKLGIAVGPAIAGTLYSHGIAWILVASIAFGMAALLSLWRPATQLRAAAT